MTLPSDARVGGEHHVGLVLGGERIEELRGRSAFPQKLVHLPRTPVAKQHFELAQGDPPGRGKCAHPRSMLWIGMVEGVLVADLGEMIVACVGVAALAIVQFVADGVVVVALETNDLLLTEQLEAPIGTGPETAEIAKAVDRIHASLPRIVDRGRQGQMIAVNATETRNALSVCHRVIVGNIRIPSRSDSSHSTRPAIVSPDTYRVD